MIPAFSFSSSIPKDVILHRLRAREMTPTTIFGQPVRCSVRDARPSTLGTTGIAAEALPAIRTIARCHPVFALCHLDPYTKRASTTPWGYAGDAVMLDYVYAGQPPSDTRALDIC
jgi:hypothetical protein